MDHLLSVKETSVCIVDETGKIIREAKVASELETLLEALRKPRGKLRESLIVARGRRQLSDRYASIDARPKTFIGRGSS